MKKVNKKKFSDANDYILKLVGLDNSHNSKGVVFKIASNKSSLLENVYWCGPSSNLYFVEI